MGLEMKQLERGNSWREVGQAAAEELTVRTVTRRTVRTETEDVIDRELRREQRRLHQRSEEEEETVVRLAERDVIGGQRQRRHHQQTNLSSSLSEEEENGNVFRTPEQNKLSALEWR
jgi:hypothetical protein